MHRARLHRWRRGVGVGDALSRDTGLRERGLSVCLLDALMLVAVGGRLVFGVGYWRSRSRRKAIYCVLVLFIRRRWCVTLAGKTVFFISFTVLQEQKALIRFIPLHTIQTTIKTV